MRILQFTLLLALYAKAGAATNIDSPHLIGVGNANLLGPFLIDETESMRYQQVYAASDFAGIQQFGGFISAIQFLADETGVFLGAQVQDVQINLSTTLAAPDGLSTVFADNVGANDTTVFDRGRWNIPSSFFGMTLTFTRPFLYDPAAGNLLLDVRVFSGARSPVFPTPFDAEETFGDSVSTMAVFDVNAPAANAGSTIGLWTRFTVDPVPEPGVSALAAVALSVLLVYGWARRRLRRREDHAGT